MFSFFSKKASVSEPTFGESQIASQSVPHVDPEAAARQLRTPSPSVAPSSEPNANAHSSPSRIPASEEPPAPPVLEPTADSLTALITSVPAQTLHSYVLAKLPEAQSPSLESLAIFFATLTPPPRLHCVRCHADFVEVENGERSCRVPHDDESAEVERIGRGAGGAEYETLYGCCGKTVEGDGSEGPPDGFCYEGKHTTDIKRARFRADSTPADDKLVSCLRLNCHGIRDALPRRANKRRRVGERDPAEAADDAASSGTEDSGVAEIARGVGALGKKDKTPRTPKSKRGAGAGDGASSAGAGASASGKKPRAPRKSKTPAKDKGKDEAVAPGEGIVEKEKAGAGDAMDVDEPQASANTTPAKKPRGRPRKQPAKDKGKEKERDGAASGVDSDAPARGRGPHGKTPQFEVLLRSRSQSRVSRVRVGPTAALPSSDAEGAKTDGEERRKKRRKVAATGAA